MDSWDDTNPNGSLKHRSQLLAEAELRGYQRGLDEAIEAVGGDEVSGRHIFSEPPWIPGAAERNEFRSELKARLEALRGGEK